MSLSAITKEDALHRAFQLQPEMVLGEKGWLLDLDCLNCNTGKGITRPDGLAVLDNGRLATVEMKLDVRGTGDTSASALARSAAIRLGYMAASVGSESVRRMRAHYLQRFVSEQKNEDDLPRPSDSGNLKLVYVIAARSFAPSTSESIQQAMRTTCRLIPPFELLLVGLEGSVSRYGRVSLVKPRVLSRGKVGGGLPGTCADNVYPSPQHRFCSIHEIEALEVLLREHLPSARLRSKHAHLGKWLLGMLHWWGLEAGDVAFEVCLSRGCTRCQLYLGKRADISDRLRPLLRAKQGVIAELAGVPVSSVEMPRSGSYLFKVHYADGTDSARIARSFAAVAKATADWSTDYIW